MDMPPPPPPGLGPNQGENTSAAAINQGQRHTTRAQQSSTNPSTGRSGTSSRQQPPRPAPEEGATDAVMNLPESPLLRPDTRRQLQAALEGLPSDAAVCDQMILLLARVRDDLSEDYRRRNELLCNEMKAVQMVVDRMNDSFVRFAIDAKCKELGIVGKKRKAMEPPSEMEHLEVLLNADQGFEEHLVFVMLVSVMSFALQNEVFQDWLDPATLRRMTAYSEVIKGTSGLGITYFGSVKEFGAQKYHTRVGALWSLVLRFVLARKVRMTVRWLSSQAETYGRDPAAHIPAWLKAFGNFSDAFKIVERIVSVEENTDRPFMSSEAGSTASRGSSGSRDGASRAISPVSRLSRAPSATRARSSRAGKESIGDQKRKRMGLTGQHDKVMELVVYAVLQTRKEFLAKLTTARNEARKILFKDILFLVEKMAHYDTLAGAETDGCRIEFVSAGAPSDQNPAEISPDHLWQIDLCERVMPTDDAADKAEIRKRNRAKFEEMSTKFPFLSVVLHWRKYATNPETGESEYLPMKESWSLYKVAADCLVAAYKWEDFDDFLSLSDLSLRSLHLHAVGLYALLRKFYGYTLCAVEVSCLGHLTWKDLANHVEGIDFSARRAVDRGAAAPVNPVRGADSRVVDASEIQDAPATCMYGGGTNVETDNEERPSLLVTYRKDHFEFTSWDEFVSARRSREEAERMEETRELTVQSSFMVSAAAGLELGEDLDWPGRAGREV